MWPLGIKCYSILSWWVILRCYEKISNTREHKSSKLNLLLRAGLPPTWKLVNLSVFASSQGISILKSAHLKIKLMIPRWWGRRKSILGQLTHVELFVLFIMWTTDDVTWYWATSRVVIREPGSFLTTWSRAARLPPQGLGTTPSPFPLRGLEPIDLNNLRGACKRNVTSQREESTPTRFCLHEPNHVSGAEQNTWPYWHWHFNWDVPHCLGAQLPFLHSSLLT